MSARAEIAPGVHFDGETLVHTVVDEFGPAELRFNVALADMFSTPYFFADEKGSERYVDPVTGEVTGKIAPRR
ncbi:hypothetical protein [Shimazuella alba]|uniref:Uncharacterized protein n=1 Tax=Shimazuella alba TaxID=2690964 RepID=A0A6I4VZG4_9BACL|nr:hypothetical protein [Shimazuella alba]MXQ53834.1 hypothetical protein [Shimazuella alba]